jgi:hypothetical protein
VNKVWYHDTLMSAINVHNVSEVRLVFFDRTYTCDNGVEMVKLCDHPLVNWIQVTSIDEYVGMIDIARHSAEYNEGLKN